MDNPEQSPKKSVPVAAYAAVVLVLLVLVVWLIKGDEEVVPPPAPQEVTPAQVVVPEPEPVVEPVIEPEPEPMLEVVAEPEPEIEPEPIVEAEPEPTHPPMEQSDSWLKDKFAEMLMNSAVTQIIGDSDNISNFVVFVDNAAKGQVVSQFSPLNSPSGNFLVKELDGPELAYVVDPETYRRYDDYATLISSLPIDAAVETYQNLQPLVITAYEELGYDDGGFNDKLKDTLDILIETPVIEGEIRLVSPAVMYEFADPALEQLLPLQKLLLRMGPDNQRKVQAFLKELKARL